MVTPEMLERILQRIIDKMVSEKLSIIGRDLDDITRGMAMSDSDNEEIRVLFLRMGRTACERFFTKMEERNDTKSKKN